MTYLDLQLKINSEKENLIKALSSAYNGLLDEKWICREACRNTLTFNLAIMIHDAIKYYPDKQMIQKLSIVCNLPENKVNIIISGLSAENECDINEAIHQLCILMYNNEYRESEN